MSACTSRHEAAEAPLIGISCGISAAGVNTLHDSYVQAIACAGGIPVIVPVLTDSAAVASVLEHLDGIVFSGGEDFDPALYGEEIIPDAGVSINAIRDTSDLLYARGALAASIPVLGICRGCQLMNVAAGGTPIVSRPYNARRKLPSAAAIRCTGEPGDVRSRWFNSEGFCTGRS